MMMAISDNKYGTNMTNLAEVINETSTVKAVDLAYEANRAERSHLGLSQAGHKCHRYCWYKHHGYQGKPIDGRILRLFQMGNLVEKQMMFDLAQAGVSITQDQHNVSFDYNGITLKGHIDGVVNGLIESSKPHLFECKTMNDKGFKKLLKDGYESYNEQYRFQIHAYALAMDLKNIFVLVYNKNDSTLYQERIKLNKDWIIDRLQDVFVAISKNIPERTCPRVDHWEAKWCDFYGECFK